MLLHIMGSWSYRVNHEKNSNANYERRAQLVLITRERRETVSTMRETCGVMREKQCHPAHEKEGDSVSLLQLQVMIIDSHYHWMCCLAYTECVYPITADNPTSIYNQAPHIYCELYYSYRTISDSCKVGSYETAYTDNSTDRRHLYSICTL